MLKTKKHLLLVFPIDVLCEEERGGEMIWGAAVKKRSK
jgi:hypothetical protein